MNILYALMCSVIIGVIYSIAGWKWRMLLRSIIIPILIGIVVLITKNFNWSLLYPILIGLDFNIGYGVNCPLQKLFNKFGWTDYNKTKWFIRAINALAISGSMVVIDGFSAMFFLNLILFVPFYTWLTCINPCKDIKIWKWTIESARVEEFIVGTTAVLLPLVRLWTS